MKRVLQKVCMNAIYPSIPNQNPKDDSPRLEIKQAMIDDSQDEHMAIGTILHRCNYLYSLINYRLRVTDKNSEQFHSYTLSIKREVKYILGLIENFYAMKTKHFEHQHSILSQLVKSLKKHR